MRIELKPDQRVAQDTFRSFTTAEILPYADVYHRTEHMPPEAIAGLARHGFLGAGIPTAWGGLGLDMITFAILNEEIGRGCSSLRSLLTVQTMVAQALLKWGTRAQKERWLPRLATGESIAAFCISEPDVGSDAQDVQTLAQRRADSYVLSGCKTWISYGQLADLLLVLAQHNGYPTAFLVERETSGVTLSPIKGLLGLRASMLAQIQLTDCSVPEENLLGKPGFGFSHVVATALHYGRFGVACGCVGIAQACLEASLRYTGERKQFGVELREHQLIRRMLTQMITGVKAARLLCYQAGYLHDTGDPRAISEVAIAKYFAAHVAMHAANDAVQIHGANGCSADYPVQRYLGDAKVMEIIEGSTQIQEILIAGDTA
jgi:glutaryl-CoA dehydrogenase (non-decarboxylating)